jgi:hypothetical protein
MAKANQSQNHELVPVETGGTDKRQKQKWMSRAMFTVGSCLLMAMVLIGPASAADGSMNWTILSDMLSGLAGIMPAFGDLIFAIIPILLIVIVVGFAIGLLDAVLDGITGAFSFMKKR